MGMATALITPFIPIAKLAYVPASGWMLKARDVPIPCAPIPMAKPLCHHAFIPRAFRIKGAKIAPKMPVLTAKIAVSVGETPMRSAIPMAIGAVTDFGYIAPVMLASAPNRRAMLTALKMETKLPAINETSNGSERPFRLAKPR